MEREERVEEVVRAMRQRRRWTVGAPATILARAISWFKFVFAWDI